MVEVVESFFFERIVPRDWNCPVGLERAELDVCTGLSGAKLAGFKEADFGRRKF